MSPPELTTSWNLLTATAALLAFLIGLYTLVGRERKSPYLINSVFLIFIVCLVGAIVDVLALIATRYRSELIDVGTVFFFLAVLLTGWRIYRIYMRFALFVDSANPKRWRLARWLKDFFRSMKDKKPYEHNTAQVPENVRKNIIEILKASEHVVEERTGLQPNSAAIALTHQGQANVHLAKIAMEFLKARYAIQYIAVSRHPIEFIEFLKSQIEKHDPNGWVRAADLTVVVDAYTRHFGFADSIYAKATREIRRLGVTYIPSAESFAGLHTAASVAFNAIRDKKAGNSVRDPVLLIYEDCYALADLESPEQYRVFIRHVLPSERAWDGMFTVVAETVQPEPDWKLLTSYVSLTLDLRVPKSENPAPEAQSVS